MAIKYDSKQRGTAVCCYKTKKKYCPHKRKSGHAVFNILLIQTTELSKKNTACFNKNILHVLKSPNSCSLPPRCYLPCHILPVPPPQVHRDLPGHQPQPNGQHLYRTRGIFLLTGGQKPASTLYSKPWQFLPLRCGRVSAGAPRDLWRPSQ